MCIRDRRATVDQTGVVSAETAFTAFGEPLTGDADSFGFAGEQFDTTGLLHLRARQYNPTIGRFTTVDPVQPGAPGTTGYNLYTYAANNPTTFTDPTGQTVLAEYAALVGDQAEATEIFAQSVGNCVNASVVRATAALEGFDLGEDPGKAVLRDCGRGTADAVLTGGAFFIGGRAVGELLEAGGRALAPGANPSIVRNALEPHEFRQAERIVEFRGGAFVGNNARNAPGIDGTLSGIPVSLKSISGSSPTSVLSNASRAERQASNAGFSGVELYIEAPNVSAPALVDFGVNGPLSAIPSQGTISAIYIQTADGWVVF